MSFSERYGYTRPAPNHHPDRVDQPRVKELALEPPCDSRLEQVSFQHQYPLQQPSNEEFLPNAVVPPLQKALATLLGENWAKLLHWIRDDFFQCEWYEVYNFVEFVAIRYPYEGYKDEFTRACNRVLESEVSAYRFVNGVVTRITEQAEIDEIDLALEKTQGPVRTHLRRALELLSDRKFPDYRNSIKESISAVESLVARIVGEKGTLGQLIKKLEDEIGLHPALRTAFSSLYGYTSDEGGIRHAILESEKIVFEDAKFFLVVCSGVRKFC